MKKDERIKWTYFPKNKKIENHLESVVAVFENKIDYIFSKKLTSKDENLKSNTILAIVRSDLEELGYEVEKGKGKGQKINVPVLYGENGVIEKSFNPDAYNYDKKTVIEVEAGTATSNNSYLKDYFEACQMENTEYLVIAVRQFYYGKNSDDYSSICTSFNTLYTSNKIQTQLKGVLIIGY